MRSLRLAPLLLLLLHGVGEACGCYPPRPTLSGVVSLPQAIAVLGLFAALQGLRDHLTRSRWRGSLLDVLLSTEALLLASVGLVGLLVLVDLLVLPGGPRAFPELATRPALLLQTAFWLGLGLAGGLYAPLRLARALRGRSPPAEDTPFFGVRRAKAP